MKLENLYDLPSLDRFIQCGGVKGFQDSYAGVVLARNLTAVDPTIFEKKYPELTFVSSGIETDNTGGYAKRIQSLRLLSRGDFKVAGDESSTKGKISLSAEDNFLKVYELTGDSTWTDSEIREAELENINLVSRYITAHNEIYLRKVDEAGFIGVEGNKGLLNNTIFDTDTATGAATSLTAQQLYDDVSGLIIDQWNTSHNTPEYMADKVTLPTTVYNIIAKKILNTAAGSSTVLKALQDNYPSVTFNSSVRCNSVSATTVTVAYSTNEQAMKFRVPVPLQIGQIVPVGSFDFTMDSKFRIAGLDILEKNSGMLLTGL